MFDRQVDQQALNFVQQVINLLQVFARQPVEPARRSLIAVLARHASGSIRKQSGQEIVVSLRPVEG